LASATPSSSEGRRAQSAEHDPPLILVNAEQRSIALPDHTVSIACLGRLADWIKTEDASLTR
jgi:hypothetical protein